MNPRKLTLLFVILLLGCEEKIEDDYIGSGSDLIVVEGIITNQNEIHTIKLSKPYSNINGEPIPVVADTIIITDQENFYGLTQETIGSGIYKSPPFRAVFGRLYILYFVVDGKEYYAFDSPPPGQLLSELKLELHSDEPGEDYSIQFIDDGTDPNYVEYLIDWSDTESCAFASNCNARIIHYDLKTVDVHEIYQPEKEIVTFPIGSTIVRKRFAISNRYQEYLRSILSETEWRGGIFDIEHANAITNLSEGAIGFFAATTVDTDTLIVGN